VAEGAGAAPLAAVLQDLREDKLDRGSAVIGLPLCGGNVDTAVFAQVLSQKTIG
jgi:threonine dehydratase